MANVSRGLEWVLPVSRTITTDASGTGWGAHLGPQLVQGSWKAEDSKRSSNWRELRAIALALRAFQQELQGQHVQVRLDNSSAIAYINRQGGTRSSSLWVLAEAIFMWAEATVLSLSVVHLKGELNQLADFLSRKMLRECDWVLNQDVYKMITRRWGGRMCGPLRFEGECEISPFLLPEQMGWGNRGGRALKAGVLPGVMPSPIPHYYPQY